MKNKSKNKNKKKGAKIPFRSPVAPPTKVITDEKKEGNKLREKINVSEYIDMSDLCS